AFLDCRGNLLHIRSSRVRADNLASKQKGNNERKHAHAQKKVNPIQYSHISSELEFLVRITNGPSERDLTRTLGESLGKAIIRMEHCRVIAVTGFRIRFP